jgi:hypothetical protein
MSQVGQHLTALRYWRWNEQTTGRRLRRGMLLATFNFRYKSLSFFCVYGTENDCLIKGLQAQIPTCFAQCLDVLKSHAKWVKANCQAMRRSRTVYVHIELTISVHSSCLLTYCSKWEKSEHRIFDKLILVPQHHCNRPCNTLYLTNLPQHHYVIRQG